MDDREQYWANVEQKRGPFDVGHATGSLSFLIDDDGRPRSEGYHEIYADSDPNGNVTYRGVRGASSHRIHPIGEYAFKGQ